jgi:hypothetical protein
VNERDQLKAAVDRYLKTLRPHVFSEKRWGGGVYGREGVSDYTGCAWGHYFAIEIKHPITRPAATKAQQIFHGHVRAARGNVLVAYSVADVAEFMALLCPQQERTPVNDSDKLLSLKEMAALLGIHPETLRKAHIRGEVRAYKIKPHVLRFDPAEVRADLRIKKESK